MGERSVVGRRIAVLGSGPVGLEAALAALERGWEVTVYEAAPQPAWNVGDWGHVRMFTPGSMNASPRMRERLQGTGSWDPGGGDATPTGSEFREGVLLPLWMGAPLAPRLRLGCRVVAVGREGLLKHEEIGGEARAERPFRILLRDPTGQEWVERADVVLDCTGKYGNPNTLGESGIPAPGEGALGDRITRRIPDLGTEAEGWAGRRILLVGAGHSAQTAARDLSELARSSPRTEVLWLVRGAQGGWGSPSDDPLPGRRALAEASEALAGGGSSQVEVLRGSAVDEVLPGNGRVRMRLSGGEGDGRQVEVDRVLSLTGGVGDHSLYRQLQVHECYATCGPMKLAAALLGTGSDDCLTQESHGVDTLRNPEPGFFILGDKSYGRNNTFLLRAGYQQVEEVFGFLGDAP